MSFQAYLDAVKAKSGHTPAELKDLANAAGVYSYDMMAGDLVTWLKQTYDLGHGHSMAVWAVFKSEGWVADPKHKS